MDLFGHNILDFPSDETIFLGDFPRVSESQYLPDLGTESLHECMKESSYDEESNDSALGSGDSLGSDTSSEPGSSEVRSIADLDILQDEDSYLNTTVSFDEVFRSKSESSQSEESAVHAVDDEVFDQLITQESVLGLQRRMSISQRKGNSTLVPDFEQCESNMYDRAQISFGNILEEDEGLHDCNRIFEVFNQMDSSKTQTILQPIKSQDEDTDANCNLDQFDFDLSGDFGLEQQEIKDDSEDLTLDDLLKSMFDVSDETDQKTDYDDFLTSILASEENLDPQYFENFSNTEEFDIDSVDPNCLKLEDEEEISIKEEVDLIEVKREVEEEYTTDYTALVLREHDYTLPATSSLFLTPPHSPMEEPATEPCTKLVRKHHTKPRNQIVKFNQSKDLKFVINLPVKKETKINSRSILKKKILEDDRGGGRAPGRAARSSDSKSKSARELVREILEKRSLSRHIEEKREFVKSMKRRMREETLKEQSESRGLKSKYRCLENVEIKSDSKKYRKFEEERELHNSMERQRRIEMKDAYDGLKDVIPGIASKDKVSKLNILNTAKEYCRGLEGKLERLGAIQHREEMRHRQLLEQLNMLQSQIL